jgi:hypothetical protein
VGAIGSNALFWGIERKMGEPPWRRVDRRVSVALRWRRQGEWSWIAAFVIALSIYYDVRTDVVRMRCDGTITVRSNSLFDFMCLWQNDFPLYEWWHGFCFWGGVAILARTPACGDAVSCPVGTRFFEHEKSHSLGDEYGGSRRFENDQGQRRQVR